MINGGHQFTIVAQQAASRKPINQAFNSLSFRGKRGYQKPYNFITKDSYVVNKMEITNETTDRDFKALLLGKRTQSQKAKSKVYGAILKYSVANRVSYALVQGRYTGKWSFPKGHSDGDESPYQCALREVNEETGITVLPNPIDFVKIGFGNYYIFEVNEEYELKPHDMNEIMNTKWVTLEEMKEMSLNVDASYFRKQLENEGKEEIK
jgi:ADP-ribose pyrophosphatase YjhB (NUDIX family)